MTLGAHVCPYGYTYHAPSRDRALQYCCQEVQRFEMLRVVEVFWVVKGLKGEGIVEKAFQFQCVEVCGGFLCGESA